MKYFYCHSYQMFNLALYYKNNLNEDIIVITEETNIVKACEYLNISYLKHKKFVFSDWEFIKKNRSVKRELSRVIKEVGESELHFSHTQSAVFCMLLIHKSKGNLFFHDFELVYPRYNFPVLKLKPVIKYAQRYLNILMISLLYKNVPLVLKKVNISGAMVGISLNYIHKKSKIKHYEEGNYYKTTLKLFKSYKLDYPKIKNLFIAQNYYVDYKSKPRNYNEILEKVFKMLVKYNFRLKKHPKFTEPSQISNLEKLPDFLPVELFFNCVENSIVSFHSASLITAGHFNKVKSISLINLINNADNELILNWRLKMSSWSTNLLFPGNIDDFESIIKN